MATLEVVSTEQVAPKERLPYWQELIWQLLGRLRSEARADGTFRGRMEYGDAGEVKLCRLSASSHRVSRTPDLIRQDDRGGARALAKRVLGKGARRLLMLVPRLQWPAIEERERGIREAIKASKVKAAFDTLACGEDGLKAGS